jgi:hypothetical protein
MIVEAVIMAKARNRMRVAAAGFPDAIELKRSGAQWFTATREPVEFDFLMSNTRASASVPSPRPSRALRAAGSAAIQ